MKRIFVAFLLAAVLIGTMLFFMPQPFEKVVMRLPSKVRSEAEATIFCRATECGNAADVGGGFMVKCRLAELSQTLKKCCGVDGLSISFEGTAEHFDEIVRRMRLQTIHRQTLCNVVAVCGYSPVVSGEISLDGARVNVQMAFDGKTITVGSPLILGEY